MIKAKKSWPSAVLVSTLLLMVLVLQAAAASNDRANGELPDGVTIAGQGQLYTLPQLQAASMPTELNEFGSTSNREPQLVIGPDSRIQITDTTVDPYRKIVSIWAGDPATDEGFGCTGTFIGARVILTAAHCIWFPEFNGWPALVVVTPGLNIDQEPFGSVEATNLWVPQGWIDAQGDIDTAAEWDYGLIVLDDDALGTTVGTMVIGVLDDDALSAPDFNPMTAGYPGDKPDGTMWFGSEPAFTAVTAIGLEHAIDSFQGQSGSAVWRAADQLIVGIESYETEEINVTLRITQSVVDDYIAVCQQLGCAFNVALDGDPPPIQADPAFQRTWERTDRPVADGQATRTWIWGPQPNTQAIMEPYDEAPNGQRQVQYYDKSRMEITNPAADSTSIWYVTNGLLATELISGQMQVGDNRFENRNPASVNVAGDANDANGPTYATFTPLLDANPSPTGTTLIQRVNRAGQVTEDPALGGQGITIGFVDQVTNHGIAAPFWNFMNSSGTVYENGVFINANLFENAFFATGRPITEPYWADVLVGGTNRLVLIQCFERRCLTYTPDNAPEWRVEMGNIGQHYFAWRYQDQGAAENPAVQPLLGQVDVGFPVAANYPFPGSTIWDTYCLYAGDPNVDPVASFASPAFEDNAVACAFLPGNVLVTADVGIFFANIAEGEYFIAWTNGDRTDTGQTGNSQLYDPSVDVQVDGVLDDIVPAGTHGDLKAGSFYDFRFLVINDGDVLLDFGDPNRAQPR